jgi:hypothetical protein
MADFDLTDPAISGQSIDPSIPEPSELEAALAGITDPGERRRATADWIVKNKMPEWFMAGREKTAGQEPLTLESSLEGVAGIDNQRLALAQSLETRLGLSPEDARQQADSILASQKRPFGGEPNPDRSRFLDPVGSTQQGLASMVPSALNRLIPGDGFSLAPYRAQLEASGERVGEGVKEYRQNLQDYVDKEKAATYALASVEQARAKAAAAVLDTQATEALRVQGDFAKVEAKRKTYVDDQLQKLQVAVDEFRSGTIDPHRLFRNADGSQNYPKAIMATIAVFLGGLGEGLQGRGGNPVLATLDAAIARDIDAQKADLDRQQSGIVAHMNLLGVMRDAFGDEKAAIMATQSLHLEAAKAQLEKIGAMQEDQAIKARADLGVSALDQKIADKRLELELHLNGVAAQQIGQLAGMATQEAQIRQQAASAEAQRAAMIAKAMESRGGKPLPRGVTGKIINARHRMGLVDQLAKETADFYGKRTAPITAGFNAKVNPLPTDASEYNDRMRILAKEAGVPEAQIPQAGDSQTKADSKLQTLRRVAIDEVNELIDTYGTQGFDVSAFGSTGDAPGFKAEGE